MTFSVDLHGSSVSFAWNKGGNSVSFAWNMERKPKTTVADKGHGKDSRAILFCK